MFDFKIPKIEIAEMSEDKKYGRFVVEPLERGYGTTLGNSLRRIMLSSLPGAAVSQVKIEGVLHEFSPIPGVKEDVAEIIMNIKKHVLVNGKAVNIPSYLVKAGDTIEIKEKNKSSQRYKDVLDATAGRVVPEWLEADSENLKGAVKNLPTREVIDVPVDEMLIVELYSK